MISWLSLSYVVSVPMYMYIPSCVQLQFVFLHVHVCVPICTNNQPLRLEFFKTWRHSLGGEIYSCMACLLLPGYVYTLLHCGCQCMGHTYTNLLLVGNLYVPCIHNRSNQQEELEKRLLGQMMEQLQVNEKQLRDEMEKRVRILLYYLRKHYFIYTCFVLNVHVYLYTWSIILANHCSPYVRLQGRNSDWFLIWWLCRVAKPPNWFLFLHV